MGDKLRLRREELKMTQEELAKRAKVSRQTINALENSDEMRSSTRTLIRIADALDTTVAALFFAENV